MTSQIKSQLINKHYFYLEFKRKTLLVNWLLYGLLVTVVEIIAAVLVVLILAVS